MDAFDYARSAGIKTVRLAIYQPKAAGFTESVVWLEDLEAFAVGLLDKAKRVDDAQQYCGVIPQETWERVYLNPTPNDEDCAFCRAKPICPSARRHIEETVGAAFPMIDENVVEKLGDMDDEALAKAMQAAPFLEEFVKLTRALVESKLLAGETVPGYGLKLGRAGARRFRDAEEAEELLLKKLRLPVGVAFKKTLRSVTQLEEFTKPQTDENGNEAAPAISAKHWERIEALVVRAEPKPSVELLSKIKTPYVPPKPSEDAFPVVSEDDLC